jgi:3-phenylpropionate/cinnamic acid dioxygenase small subunit
VVVRSNYVVVQTRADGSPFLFQTGVYHDEVVPTAEGWRYRVKRAVYDSPLITTLLVIPV